MDKDLVFKALADPTRRLILDELSERKEQTLYELTARLIMRREVGISRQALAKHIDLLEQAGLVSSEKRGKYRMLVFNDEPSRLSWIDGSSDNCQEKRRADMRITLTSVFVSDQDQALRFYTETLGFVKKHDVPVGEFKWLTVVSPDDPDGAELLLEPNDNPVAREYQKGIFDQGIPATSFSVIDIHAEYEKLKLLGVAFTMEPTEMANVTIAVFDDTCGNLIQIMQT